jgi:penicillin amidase
LKPVYIRSKAGFSSIGNLIGVFYDSRMRRPIALVLASLLLLLVLVGGGHYVYLRQSLPVVGGAIRVTGPVAAIEIVRDAAAVPHIVAASKTDAFFGLGYVHAQDRLWQMEFQRRIGHGRLSEIFGAATVPQDRFLRTVGFGRSARSAWERLPADARQQLEAYLAGVNAFVDTHRGRGLPPEFTLLRFAPEPFTGPDVIVWAKMMSWDLSANYSLELMRQDLAARAGQDRLADLLPPYAADALSIVSATAGDSEGAAVAIPAPAHASAAPLFQALSASLAGGHPDVRAFLLGSHSEALGSNNWVVDGTMTATGKPLLANDPHLGTKIPSLWYLAHLSWPGGDMAGATLPGIPAVAIGRNRNIAWGETNVAADVQDLYRERLDAAGTQAEFKGRFEPIRRLTEQILVNGGAPVQVEVRITRHGPLISDAINANNRESASDVKPAPLEPLAFRWTSLDEDDQTIVAFLRLNEARNWSEFLDALRLYLAPSQNFVYADNEGHIGYIAPGSIPIRATGDGAQPVDGWSGDAEWTGWVPFEELPQTFDPPAHFIVTANHRPMPAGHPRLIGLEWPDPYRAQRITERLSGRHGLTVDDMRDLQADTLSLHAKALLPRLLAHVQTENSRTRQAVDILKRWDFQATPDSTAEAIFQAWFLQLAPTLVGDELGAAVLESYRGRFSYITRFVTNLTQGRHTSWCDNIGTPAAESCEQSITAALDAGLADLTSRLGETMDRWRWDAVHRAVFPHQGLDSVAPLRWLLSRAMPNGGDWSTVNVGPVSVSAPYDQVSIPGYRQVLDLSPANDNRLLDAVGQSGHFLSRFYDDALGDWQAVRLRKLRWTRAEYEDGAIGRLRLEPVAR